MSCCLLSFQKAKTFFLHQLNAKNIGPVLLFKTIYSALILFPVVCLLQWIARIENGLKLRQDIQQPVKYETDSDDELKATKKVTLKKSVAGHA